MKVPRKFLSQILLNDETKYIYEPHVERKRTEDY